MNIQSYFSQLQLPVEGSHKGQNGKLLIIGGSELFHAASKWSLDIASKFVDMVFYSSVPSNNDLVLQAKGEFWNGIVIKREEIESYIQEADCILIGPGMTRTPDTTEITNFLIEKYSTKKWVIDAGALQQMKPELLQSHMIITPHRQEFERLLSHIDEVIVENNPLSLSKKLGGVTIVLKGRKDQVFNDQKAEMIEGGNVGMTKGGTGDVLAGLIAALYCKNDALTSAVIGSYVNKAAGDQLHKRVGPLFNASDLVNQIPETLWTEYKAATA
jgi:ADP-dependent NAD(P)H-hydrate dehydratase / NAD(P)H-hydrate epimerase